MGLTVLARVGEEPVPIMVVLQTGYTNKSSFDIYMKIITKILAITLLIVPFSVSAKTFDSNLYFGITNNSDVQMLQEFLTDQGVYSGPITGNFFSLTLAAVKKYQSQNNITPAAGFFGPITRVRANDILSAQTQNSDAQAIAETGTITPPVTQNTTIDNNQQLMLSLQVQISLLLQQIAQMQRQGTQTSSQPASQTPAQTTQITQNQPTQTNSNTTTSAIRISIGGNNGAIGNETNRTLYVGETNQLAPTLAYPAGSTYSSFIWSSSDPTVASVSSGGLVTALKAGLTIITVTTTVNGSVIVSAADAITVLQLQAQPTQTTSTQTQNTQTQTTDLQISSVQIKTDTYSAIIEWQISKPATSKIFISAANVSTKVVPSESGLSSRHIANITGLVPDKNYSFEIEAVVNNVSVKRNGEFRTLPAPLSSPLQLALRKDILENSLRSNYVEILVEQNPQNTGNQTGKKWEISINDQLMSITPSTNANLGWARFNLTDLTPETTYAYKVVYKEDGRQDSVITGTFKTLSKRETVACKFIFSHNYGQVNAGEMFIHLDVNSHGDGNQLLNFTFSCNPGDFASIKLISMDMKYGNEWYDYNFNRMSKFAPMEINFSNSQFNDNYILNFSSDGLIIRAPQTVNIPGSKTINLHNSSPVNFNVTIKDTVVQSARSNDPITFSFSNLKFSDDAGNQYTVYIP